MAGLNDNSIIIYSLNTWEREVRMNHRSAAKRLGSHIGCGVNSCGRPNECTPLNSSANLLMFSTWVVKRLENFKLSLNGCEVDLNGPRWPTAACHGFEWLRMVLNGIGFPWPPTALKGLCFSVLADPSSWLSMIFNGPQISAKAFYQQSTLKIIDNEAQWFPIVSSRSTGTNGSRGPACRFHFVPRLTKHSRRFQCF